MNQSDERHMEKMRELGEILAEVETDKRNGDSGFSVSEVAAMMRAEIEKTEQ